MGVVFGWAKKIYPWQFAPEGSGYRARTRFAKFQNLPDGICFLGGLKKTLLKAWQPPVYSDSSKVVVVWAAERKISMEITYTRVGDYLLPDIILSDPPDAEPLTKYGMMRKTSSKAISPRYTAKCFVMRNFTQFLNIFTSTIWAF